MTFTLLPAVDVADGRVSGLARVESGPETLHEMPLNDGTDTPLGTALAWQRDGANWIHLVDLDAAFGRGSNDEALREVVGELDVHVELSGGIRDDATLERALASGCSRVIVATDALRDLRWCTRSIAAHGDRIAVGLDVRIEADSRSVTRHRLIARGTSLDVGDLWETLALLDRAGCSRYVVTDVDKDASLTGPNVQLYRAVCEATSTPVIASGGISAIADLLALAEVAAEVAAEGANLEGSILGKALYAGRFSLPEALVAIGRYGNQLRSSR